MRRGNGEGSVYKRKRDGLWMAAVTLPNGRRTCRSARSKGVARQRLHDLQRELSHGTVDSRNPQLKTYFREWLDAAGPRLRPNTLCAYGYTLKWVEATIGNLKLRAISRNDVAWAVEQLGPLSPASIRVRHAGLRSVLRQAEEDGLILRNPASGIRLPVGEPRPIEPLNELELQSLIASTPDVTRACLWALLGTSALRISEALGLRWSNVDLNSGTVSVVAQLYHVAGHVYELREPKTRTSRRMVCLADQVVALLQRQRVAQKLDQLATGPAYENDLDLAFTTSTGRPMYHSDVSRRFREDLELAGCRRIRIHDLRHTAATIALQRTHDAKLVSDMLGHRSIATTLDVYAHVAPAGRFEIAQVMSEALAAGSGA